MLAFEHDVISIATASLGRIEPHRLDFRLRQARRRCYRLSWRDLPGDPMPELVVTQGLETTQRSFSNYSRSGPA
jgi:hypothetical protein